MGALDVGVAVGELVVGDLVGDLVGGLVGVKGPSARHTRLFASQHLEAFEFQVQSLYNSIESQCQSK